MTELIIGKRAAQLDVLREITPRVRLQGAQQHAGQTNRMGFGFKLLSMWHKYGRYRETIGVFGHMIHGIRQKAARATRRVIEGTNQTRIGLE